jgi:glycerol-3-phosphate dehydrogenase
VAGVRVRDRLNDWRGAVAAPVVIAAAGPWTDTLAATGGSQAKHPMRRIKGVHILTDALQSQTAVRLPVDGGYLVFSPWRKMTLIGSLNIPMAEGDQRGDAMRVTSGEIDTLVARANRALKAERLTRADVRHAFAGIRPVPVQDGKRPLSAAAKRRWEVTDHGDQGLDGFISVLSGNWTRARRIAQRAVDLGVEKIPHDGRKIRGCRTAITPLWGGEVWRMRLFRNAARLRHPEIAPTIVQNLVNAYGSRYREVLALAAADDRYWARLDPDRPEIAAQVVYAVRREWARSVDDVIYRRIGLGQTGLPSEIALNAVADLMAEEFDWGPGERDRQIDAARERYRIDSHASLDAVPGRERA